MHSAPLAYLCSLQSSRLGTALQPSKKKRSSIIYLQQTTRSQVEPLLHCARPKACGGGSSRAGHEIALVPTPKAQTCPAWGWAGAIPSRVAALCTCAEAPPLGRASGRRRRRRRAQVSPEWRRRSCCRFGRRPQPSKCRATRRPPRAGPTPC